MALSYRSHFQALDEDKWKNMHIPHFVMRKLNNHEIKDNAMVKETWNLLL